MAENKVHILSTRPLPESVVMEAKQEGILIDEVSFIETEPIQTIEVQQEIEQAFIQSATVIFTSMNAVEAVISYEEDKPDWTIYCLGNTTRNLVIKYFGEDRIAGTANSAMELAEMVAEESGVEEVIFFCGDQRRDELPAILREHGIEVTEIVVYQTIPVYHKIEKPYNGILFFSPSAVESFFRNNKPLPNALLFAIGKTTAETIKRFASNKVITGTEPGKLSLVREMMEYFA